MAELMGVWSSVTRQGRTLLTTPTLSLGLAVLGDVLFSGKYSAWDLVCAKWWFLGIPLPE